MPRSMRAPGHAAKLLARKVLARDGPDTPSINHGRRFFAFEDRCISPLTSSNAGVRRPSIRVDHSTMHPGRQRSNMRRQGAGEQSVHSVARDTKTNGKFDVVAQRGSKTLLRAAESDSRSNRTVSTWNGTHGKGIAPKDTLAS